MYGNLSCVRLYGCGMDMNCTVVYGEVPRPRAQGQRPKTKADQRPHRPKTKDQICHTTLLCIHQRSKRVAICRSWRCLLRWRRDIQDYWYVALPLPSIHPSIHPPVHHPSIPSVLVFSRSPLLLHPLARALAEQAIQPPSPTQQYCRPPSACLPTLTHRRRLQSIST
jgi:hypothetical protein